MSKTIFITGSTDGIGLEAAKALAAKGHNVLLHGRNAAKLSGVNQTMLFWPSLRPFKPTYQTLKTLRL
jgi:short-subunit dehydrogenase